MVEPILMGGIEIIERYDDHARVWDIWENKVHRFRAYLPEDANRLVKLLKETQNPKLASDDIVCTIFREGWFSFYRNHFEFDKPKYEGDAKGMALNDYLNWADARKKMKQAPFDGFSENIEELIRCLNYSTCEGCGAFFKDEIKNCVDAHHLESKAILDKFQKG